MREFWQWESLGPYLRAITTITTFLAGATIFFGKYDIYATLLGTLSSGVEVRISSSLNNLGNYWYALIQT